jgi:U32 family peptidase
MKYEVLSPAGNMEKLKTAVLYGANAVYFAGKSFGLRAFAGNFSREEILEAVKYCHEKNVKAYVTVNIVAHNKDFDALPEYLIFLQNAGVDAIIVSDIGIAKLAREVSPKLDLHISTQANVTNKFSAKVYADMGASRIVLARELTLTEIKEIRAFLPKNVELEAFVHGAMCISYSGRCLLSNYLSGRASNNGECIQACRWNFEIREKNRGGEFMPIEEDERGTYILNSKDLNMIAHLDDLANAGVTSFKIEGRMKSPYYVATVTNAYRRAVDVLEKSEEYHCPEILLDELEKTSHRKYTTGFNYKDKQKEESEYILSSQPVQTDEFVAIVTKSSIGGVAEIEMRNRFCVTDELNILSYGENFNKKLEILKLTDQNGNEIFDAKLVQQKLFLTTPYPLFEGEIIRRRK